jgi:hypothetical protein
MRRNWMSGGFGILNRSSELWTPDDQGLDFAGFLAECLCRFGLNEHLEFIRRETSPFPVRGWPLDLLLFRLSPRPE